MNTTGPEPERVPSRPSSRQSIDRPPSRQGQEQKSRPEYDQYGYQRDDYNRRDNRRHDDYRRDYQRSQSDYYRDQYNRDYYGKGRSISVVFIHWLDMSHLIFDLYMAV